MRKLFGVDLVILDDVTPRSLDATATSDLYDLAADHHRGAAAAWSSNRDPSEWLAVMSDPCRAKSAIDRLSSAAWELVIDGESYRTRERPTLQSSPDDTPPGRGRPRR